MILHIRFENFSSKNNKREWKLLIPLKILIDLFKWFSHELPLKGESERQKNLSNGIMYIIICNHFLIPWIFQLIESLYNKDIIVVLCEIDSHPLKKPNKRDVRNKMKQRFTDSWNEIAIENFEVWFYRYANPYSKIIVEEFSQKK